MDSPLRLFWSATMARLRPESNGPRGFSQEF
jgi:hypothetical protein